jgi:hypothetical protein
MPAGESASGGLSRRRLLVGAAGLTIATAGASLATGAPAEAAQGLWRWCWQCASLWYSGNGNNGYCPVGSGLFGWDHSHQRDGSGNYVIKSATDPGRGEPDWRWCGNCAVLWAPDWTWKTQDYCPNGPGNLHIQFGSGNYKLEISQPPGGSDGPGGQPNWFLCMKCTGLFFAGNGTNGTCPAGGAHRHWDPTEPQVGWNYKLREA